MKGIAIDAPVNQAAFVVDTSVVGKFFLDDEQLVPEARRLLTAYEEGRIDLIAPFSLHYELPATILRARGTRRISTDEARVALDSFLELRIRTISLSGDANSRFISRSYELADLLMRSFYDALFIATAQLLSLPLMPADRPLFEATRGSFDVRWLGNFDLP